MLKPPAILRSFVQVTTIPLHTVKASTFASQAAIAARSVLGRCIRRPRPCLLTALLVGSSFARLYCQTTNAPVSVGVPTSAVVTGTVQWSNGSTKDEGQATLKVSANGAIEESWALSRATTGLQITVADGVRSCASTDTKGKATLTSSLSCYRQVPWFAPWMARTLLASGSLASADATTDADRKAGWTRTTYTMAMPPGVTLKPKKAAALKELIEASSVNIVVDTKTSLPVQMVFLDHPNSDPASAIETVIHYDDYRQEGGFTLPHHMQRYVQHSLQADLVISNISIN